MFKITINDRYEQRIISLREWNKQKTVATYRKTVGIIKLVSFYGNSPSTAKYGLLIHPKGNKPSHRTNYLELKHRLKEKKVNEGITSQG